MEQYLSLLKEVALFEEIAEEDLRGLLRCLAAEVRSYQKEEFIFLLGEPARSVGVILSGRVHVLKEDRAGNRTILAAPGRGDLFGEAFACARTQWLPVSVAAAEPCEIMMIDYRRIVTSCPSACVFHTRLIENMLGIVASKNVALNKKVEIISKRTTREKLTAYLSEQAQRAGGTSFAIPFNRQELADYLCVERSAMSAELSRMQRDGLIRTDKHRFELLF